MKLQFSMGKWVLHLKVHASDAKEVAELKSALETANAERDSLQNVRQQLEQRDRDLTSLKAQFEDATATIQNLRTELVCDAIIC